MNDQTELNDESRADGQSRLNEGLGSARYDDGMTVEDDKKFNRQWDVSEESWVCQKCGQTNAHWARTCGRCGDAQRTLYPKSDG